MINALLEKRCSVRAFNESIISDEDIEQILEAGRLSPSGGNEQSWKFGVITNKNLIHEISEASYNQTWIKTSPLLIVLCTIAVDDSRGARNIQEKRFPRFKEQIREMDKELYTLLNLEEHQTKIAGAHMSLCALEKGIYSTWISFFDVEKVGKILKLPSNCIPSEILAFGYPLNQPRLTNKKDMKEVIFYNYNDTEVL